MAADQDPPASCLRGIMNGLDALFRQLPYNGRVMDQFSQRAGCDTVSGSCLCGFHSAPYSHTEARVLCYFNGHCCILLLKKATLELFSLLFA